jgi:hypothetical protein
MTRKRCPLVVESLFLRMGACPSFLNYGRYLGEVLLDLAAAVPIVANWSMTSIPRAISAEHVSQLLASIDRRTAAGRRDYAILLLLARLVESTSALIADESSCTVDVGAVTSICWVTLPSCKEILRVLVAPTVRIMPVRMYVENHRSPNGFWPSHHSQ